MFAVVKRDDGAGEFLVGALPFASDQHEIAGTSHGDSFSNGEGAVRLKMIGTTAGDIDAAGDGAANLLNGFAARIITREDDMARETAGDLAKGDAILKRGAFGSAEHQDNSFRAQFLKRSQDFLEVFWNASFIDINERLFGNELAISRRCFKARENRAYFSRA
jgi:hypothetical protein